MNVLKCWFDWRSNDAFTHTMDWFRVCIASMCETKTYIGKQTTFHRPTRRNHFKKEEKEWKKWNKFFSCLGILDELQSSTTQCAKRSARPLGQGVWDPALPCLPAYHFLIKLGHVHSAGADPKWPSSSGTHPLFLFFLLFCSRLFLRDCRWNMVCFPMYVFVSHIGAMQTPNHSIVCVNASFER